MSFVLEQVKNGKDIILYNSYKYRESYALKCGDIVWRCLGKCCKASIKTNIEKTDIYSCNEKHTGPHPVTMRALTPPKQQLKCSSPSNTTYVDLEPRSSTRLEPSSTPMSSQKTILQHCGHDDTTPASPDLHAENNLLREELARVRAERQMVLDHSIESDQRLLQFTEDVFLPPASMAHYTQSESSEDRLRETERELQRARETIKTLESIIASNKGPCHGCEVQAEETKNMIASIGCLEAEIECLKQRMNTTAAGEVISLARNLTTSNRFDVLSDSEKDMESDLGFITASTKKTKKNKKKKMKRKNVVKPVKEKPTRTPPTTNSQLKIPFRNITLVGDSHARHLTTLIRPLVHPATDLSGMCKPGAGLVKIAPTSSPPPENCYVIMAGTNDVDNHREDVIFSHLEDILKRCSPISSILLMPLTPRYDLSPNSHVHRTVHRVNHFMGELCRRYDGVDLLDIRSIGRQHYTSHGLHLRTSGKKLLANLIAKHLALMRPQRPPVHPLTSREDIMLAATSQPSTQEYDTYADAVLRVPSKTSITPQESETVISTAFLVTSVQDVN